MPDNCNKLTVRNAYADPAESLRFGVLVSIFNVIYFNHQLFRINAAELRLFLTIHYTMHRIS